ncbi:MAG: hypothetical protein HWE27_04325 [Gammaproteobacteria bacterium]|nr:hypothetical protein [Gammaproteobacteria bacterium]
MSSEREKLLRQRQTLQERVEAIKQDFKSGLPADSEERAQQLENADVLNALMQHALKEIEKIDSKLSS